MIPGTPAAVAPPVAISESRAFGNPVGNMIVVLPPDEIAGTGIHCRISVSTVLPLYIGKRIIPLESEPVAARILIAACTKAVDAI